MNVIYLLLKKNKIIPHNVSKAASVSAKWIIVVMTAVESELIVEAETHQHIKVKRIFSLIIVVTEHLIAVLVSFAELPFLYCGINIIENVFNIMILEFLKNINNMIIYIISVGSICNGINANITTAAKKVNKSIYMLRKALLNRVYYPVFVTYIIKRCFNSQINASSKGITVL